MLQMEMNEVVQGQRLLELTQKERRAEPWTTFAATICSLCGKRVFVANPRGTSGLAQFNYMVRHHTDATKEVLCKMSNDLVVNNIAK